MLEFYSRLAAAFGELSVAARIALGVGLMAFTTLLGFGTILALPSDHFVPRAAKQPVGWRRHRVLTVAVTVVRNLLGLILVPLGVVMSLPLVPGPGVLFIVLGLSLMNFPGKKRLERRMLASPRVGRFLNDVRARFGRPPIELG